jgi:hypothetical protein
MSDVVATTQSMGVEASGEDQFQGLWDSGAFDPAGIPPKEPGGQENPTNDAPPANNGPQIGDEPTDAVDPNAPKGPVDDKSTYSSLDELLTSMKVDPESVRTLPVTVKIDGVETQVPLQDVLKSYQLEGHVNNKSIELSNQKTQFEQERTAARTLFQQQIQQNSALGNLAMQMLTHEYQQVDWNALRAQNPAEFAALNAEFHQRQGQIQNYLQAVQQQSQMDAQQQQQSMQQAIAGEREKLMSVVPEWRNQETFTKDRDAMSQYARSLGFKDAELNQIFDHRYMRVLHDAARYQALQAAKPEALKQVRQAPKVVAPGSRVEKNPQDASRQAAIDRFNRNPRDMDAQAAVFGFLTD